MNWRMKLAFKNFLKKWKKCLGEAGVLLRQYNTIFSHCNDAHTKVITQMKKYSGLSSAF